MDSLYRERIIDHYRRPRSQGVLDAPDFSSELDNPVCGDVARIDVQLEGSTVAAARWSGRGCVISLASASMLTDALIGKQVEELRTLEDEDIYDMLGFRPGPVRARCALLALRVLQEGLCQTDR